MTDTSGPRIELNPGNGPDYEVTKSPPGSTARDKDLRIAELEEEVARLKGLLGGNDAPTLDC